MCYGCRVLIRSSCDKFVLMTDDCVMYATAAAAGTSMRYALPLSHINICAHP